MKKLLLFLLLCSPLDAAVSFVGVGTTAEADNANVTPTLHGSTAANDLILVLAAAANTDTGGTLACPGGYTTQASYNHSTVLQMVLCSKIAVGGDAAPTVGFTGGSAGMRVAASAATFRGINTSSFVNVISGAGSLGETLGTIGPITAITPTATNGAVIVFAAKHSWWASVATLTGDSLTWAEIAEYQTDVGAGVSLVWDYALWTGAAPSLTAKTFTITTDGITGRWGGGMLSLNEASAASITPKLLSQRRRRNQ